MRAEEHNAHIDKAEQELNKHILRTRMENQKRKREEEQHEYPDREWKVDELIELRKEFEQIKIRLIDIHRIVLGLVITWVILIGHLAIGH